MRQWGLGIAVSCCLGMVSKEYINIPWIYSIIGSLIFAGSAGILRAHKLLFWWCVFACFFCIGAGRMDWVDTAYEKLPFYLQGADLRMEGTILEKGNTYDTEKGKMTRYVVALRQFTYADDTIQRQGQGNIYVTMPTDEIWQPTARISLRGTMQPITYYRNYGAYDAFHRDKEKSIYMKTYIEDSRSIQLLAAPTGWRYALQQMREHLTNAFQRVLSRDNAYILSSLLFGGHYEDLPPELIESFSTTGLIHILSVSGSHIALLLTVIQLVGKTIGLREKGLFFLSVFFVIAYSALSEFVSPVIRASVMGIICAYSVIAEREYMSSHALAIAVLLMALYSPFIVYDLSFRLSCGASAGIVLLQPKLKQYLDFLPIFIRDSVSVCVCAQLLLLPVLLANFFSLPVYALAANVLIAPVLDMVIVLGLLAAICFAVCEPLMEIVLWILSPLLAISVKGNYFLSSLPYSRYWIGALSFPWIVAWYVILGAIFFWTSQRRNLFIITGLWLVGTGIYGQYQKPEATVYVFDVGKDKATCIRYSDSSAYLWYNKSQWASPMQASSVLVPALRYAGIFHLTGCVVSGYEAEKTARQLEQAVTLRTPCRVQLTDIERSDGWSHDIPYYIYDAIPQKEFSSQGCIEIRNLSAKQRIPFPKQADAIIVYRNHARDDVYTEWLEWAAYKNILCYSPSRDGQIIGTYRQGVWRFTTYGGETNDESNSNYIWNRTISDGTGKSRLFSILP